MSDLQLYDYKDGYRFRVLCQTCQYGWYEEPGALLQRPDIHDRMYLEELALLLECRACHTRNSKITPIIITSHHHFIGGLA